MKEMTEYFTKILQDVETLLCEKNEAYGNSAGDPVRIFSRSDPLEQINVRLDDKLSRIARGDASYNGEDVELDIIGYLVLKKAILMKHMDDNVSGTHDINAWHDVNA